MKWYKRDPDAFFAATRALTLEERGAYNDLLDMLYARDGNVPDDDRLMSRNLCCDPRTWRKLKASLIAAGKVRVEGGKLTANRVNSELTQAHLRLSEMSRLGRVSAEIRKKRRENNGGTPTAPLVTTTSTTTVDKKAKKPSHLPRSKTKAFSRAPRARTSLPENWHPELVGEVEFDRFCDHARANGRLCADWEAARRNWNRSPYRNQGGSNGHGRRHGSVLDAFDRLGEKLNAQGSFADQYVPGSSGPTPLRLDQDKRPTNLKLIPKR